MSGSASGSGVIPPPLFNRELYLRRQACASPSLALELDRRLAQELSDRLSVVNRAFGRTCLAAVRPANALASLAATGKFSRIEPVPPPAGDAFDLGSECFDCVVSLMDLHVVNDVPGYVVQVARALKPDGLALFAFFAGGTLRELREALLAAEHEMTGGATPRVAPMIDIREAGGLLQRAGLALPVADLDRLTLRYGEVMGLMREIKALGFSNCLVERSKGLTSPALLLRAAAAYAGRFADADGRLPATVEIAWATAWKQHPSQQRPLKPGSAKARLADALRPPPSQPGGDQSGAYSK